MEIKITKQFDGRMTIGIDDNYFPIFDDYKPDHLPKELRELANGKVLTLPDKSNECKKWKE